LSSLCRFMDCVLFVLLLHELLHELLHKLCRTFICIDISLSRP
jgi:hypothetical protein